MVKKYSILLVLLACFLSFGFGPLAHKRGAFQSSFSYTSTHFDGTDYMRRSLTITDSKECTLSMWLNIKAADDTSFTLLISANERVHITRNSSNRLQGFFENSAGTTIARFLLPDDTLMQADGWVHLYVSFDLTDTGERHVLLNGSDASPNWLTYTNDTIDFSDGNWTVGANQYGSQDADVDLCEVWMASDYNGSAYTDFNSASKPIDLSSHSITPFLYLKNAYDSFEVNSGDGGTDFTVTGTLTAGSDTP